MKRGFCLVLSSFGAGKTASKFHNSLKNSRDRFDSCLLMCVLAGVTNWALLLRFLTQRNVTVLLFCRIKVLKIPYASS
ncbi:putative restriction endonuclease [Klebsiella pneumoniae]|uniref:Putative restriction endonuclease n=1 Tax=Klebsiella pneumoniae TaxID=573 RepID=A0A2X3FI97_KLEPN|nr:putative restriction endonuclease [Klebsiella pneumoniae]